MLFRSWNVTNILVPKLFGFAKFFRFIIISTSFFSGDIACSLRTRENSDVYNILDEIYLVFT